MMWVMCEYVVMLRCRCRLECFISYVSIMFGTFCAAIRKTVAFGCRLRSRAICLNYCRHVAEFRLFSVSPVSFVAAVDSVVLVC